MLARLAAPSPGEQCGLWSGSWSVRWSERRERLLSEQANGQPSAAVVLNAFLKVDTSDIFGCELGRKSSLTLAESSQYSTCDKGIVKSAIFFTIPTPK